MVGLTAGRAVLCVVNISHFVLILSRSFRNLLAWFVFMPVQFWFAAAQYKVTVTNGNHTSGRFRTWHFWSRVIVPISSQLTAETAPAVLSAIHFSRLGGDQPTRTQAGALLKPKLMPTDVWRIFKACDLCYAESNVVCVGLFVCLGNYTKKNNSAA